MLKEACAACGEAITARKGRIIIKDEARVVHPLHYSEINCTCTVSSACLRLLSGHSTLPSCIGENSFWCHRHDVWHGDEDIIEADFCAWCHSLQHAEAVGSDARPCMCAQVSDRDDRLLTEQMLALETANQEVAGDDDSEEEEVGMGEMDVNAPAPLPA